MRILLVSDLHYSLRQFDWVVEAAPEYDLVVVAGDHLDISSSVELDAQIVVVLRYLQLIQASAPLAVSSGNHDLSGADANGERAALWLDEARAAGVPTDGDSILLGDTLVTICPWWDGPAGRDTVVAQLERDAAQRPHRWVWVYHWPPVGSPTSWTGKQHYGDPDVLEWIERFRPDLVLTGHVHEPPFKPDGSWYDRIRDTWVFNPGRQGGATPTRIDIDLADDTGPVTGEAAWLSLAGIESISLDVAAPEPAAGRGQRSWRARASSSPVTSSIDPAVPNT